MILDYVGGLNLTHGNPYREPFQAAQNQRNGGIRESFDSAGFEDGRREQSLEDGKDQETHPPLKPPEENTTCSHLGFSPEEPGPDFSTLYGYKIINSYYSKHQICNNLLRQQ